MNRTVVGVDIAKRVFQLHWVEIDSGELVSVQLKRAMFRACQIFCVRAGCIDQSLKVKRSPNWIASCALAACHAIGGRFHFSVMWRRASQMSLVAA